MGNGMKMEEGRGMFFQQEEGAWERVHRHPWHKS
jgi:hypothetical protein